MISHQLDSMALPNLEIAAPMRTNKKGLVLSFEEWLLIAEDANK